MNIFNKKGNLKININNKVKIIISFIIGGILCGTSVFADIVINSNEVSYSSNGNSTVQGALDDLYSKATTCNYNPVTPERIIKAFNTEGETISTTDHENELRFIGANPPNYVKFNNQVWRIIGIFDGKLKLVSSSIGNYSFDTSKNNVNRGLGVNAWEDADLMKLLNPGYESNSDFKCNTSVTVGTESGKKIANCGNNSSSAYTTGLVNNSLYWNAGSGKCYNYGNNQVTDCNFSSSSSTPGLSDSASKSMIDNNEWYLGSNNKSDSLWGGIMTASYLYNMERGSLTGKQCTSDAYYCSDTVTRANPPRWTGKVGLIYPSDYAYATSGSTSTSGTSRATCLSKQVGYAGTSTPNWDNTYTDCKNNDWLLNTSLYTWTISPRGGSTSSIDMFRVNIGGYVDSAEALLAESVRPVVYLKSNVTITKGDGTSSNPFILSME